MFDIPRKKIDRDSRVCLAGNRRPQFDGCADRGQRRAQRNYSTYIIDMKLSEVCLAGLDPWYKFFHIEKFLVLLVNLDVL
jgi:hypothetical protein